MWCLDQDSALIEVLYLIASRAQVAEAFANVPYDEWPTKDELESYIPRNLKDDDFAWGDLFPKALAWINDREIKKKRKAREEI